MINKQNCNPKEFERTNKTTMLLQCCRIARNKIFILALLCNCISNNSFAVIESVTGVDLLENCSLLLDSICVPKVWEVKTTNEQHYVAISLQDAQKIIPDIQSNKINRELSIRDETKFKIIKKFPHMVYRFEQFSWITKCPSLSPVFDQNGSYTFFPYYQIKLVILVPDD